jgi:hypothetical protein
MDSRGSPTGVRAKRAVRRRRRKIRIGMPIVVYHLCHQHSIHNEIEKKGRGLTSMARFNK